MALPADPGNSLRKPTPSPAYAKPIHGPADTDPSGQRRSRAGAAKSRIGAFLGAAMLAIAIWGFWVSADIARYYGTASVGPEKDSLAWAIFLLSWLVLFGPFLYFGIVLLRSTFAPEERVWLVPLRVFTYLVGLRASAEMRRQNFLHNAGAKTTPPRLPEKSLDAPRDSSRDPERS